MERRTKHDLRSAGTRERLMAAGRELFAARGYADVGTEEIVRAAGVTRGALYHQFRDKADLFTAVVEMVEAEVVQRVASELGGVAVDPVAGMLAAAGSFLSVCVEPGVERILREAPTVLGAQAWREISSRHGLGLVQQAVTGAIESGALRQQPAAPLAHLLMGALDEATRYVAAAEDPAQARQECLHALSQMVDGVRP